jgi:hypothetical protein
MRVARWRAVLRAAARRWYQRITRRSKSNGLPKTDLSQNGFVAVMRRCVLGQDPRDAENHTHDETR